MTPDEFESYARRVVRLLNSRDADALSELADPELEFRSRFSTMEGGVYQGPEAFAQYFADMDDAWADIRWDIAEILGGSGDDFVVLFHVTGRGLTSDAPFEVFAPQHWKLRGDRAVRLEIHDDVESAMRAAGLG